MSNLPTESNDFSVTLILVTYNQERFVDKAVTAVISQTYDDLEIIISDDCSTDQTAQVIDKTLQTFPANSRNVRFIKNKKNHGWPAHLNFVLEQTTGDLIVIAAGDDISAPNRVQDLVGEFKKDRENTMLLFSDVTMIDNDGQQLNRNHTKIGLENMSLYAVVKGNHFASGATCAINRRLWDEFGPLLENTINEDRAWPTRAALIGRTSYVNKKLVSYRAGGISDSCGQLKKLERFIQDYRQKISDLQKIADTEKLGRICRIRIAQLTLKYYLASVNIKIRSSIKMVVRLILPASSNVKT